MLDNLNICIQECSINHFDEYEKVYCVDCWWVDEDNDNKYYALDEPFERGGVIATISEDGSGVEWKDNFKDAITNNAENTWVFDEIKNAQRWIKEEFNK